MKRLHRLSLVALLVAGLIGNLRAEPATPGLPPPDAVARALRASPAVLAAQSQIRVEEANRQRLSAGHYEWNVRMGTQQRRTRPTVGPDERFAEWNAALERPIRLPGKGALDDELGAAGIALAESAFGDALHEGSRDLLKSWFLWLRETAAATQWAEQLALLDSQAEAVKRRQQLGDAARLETMQAEAARAQAAAQLVQARTRQQSASEDLRRRYPGLPLGEPAALPDPQALERDQAAWIEAILANNHELAMANGETRRARIAAERSRAERLPDPSLGIQYSRERGGEEQVVGAYISIPLAGSARRATADAALAQADSNALRAAAIARRIDGEASALYLAAAAGFATWQAAQASADSLGRAAEMTARAYRLGEGTLNDLLNARRLANEAALAARLSRLDAHELRYRLLLDAHELWDLD